MDLLLRIVAGGLLIVLGLGLFGLALCHAARRLDDGPQEKTEMTWAADRADGLTGLTRTPRAGDHVRYRGDGAIRVATVKRLEGNLCWCEPDDPREQARWQGAPFIWRFREGLNRHFTLVEGES